MGSLRYPHPTQDQPKPPEEFGIDSKIGAATTRAPAASQEESHYQAILKFHRLSGLDYRAHNLLPVLWKFIVGDQKRPKSTVVSE